ncbi:hypothetical protein XELAEV_18024152mg [Xenopus laevis]|uniref:Uncharacterized protein n=1 Tax=Xenopus laevis TaxID=8355 RepID=A0A974HPS6_XENLA|nr:hypothetical protein XELAEV_18024152mg [Xenopus laevis]
MPLFKEHYTNLTYSGGHLHKRTNCQMWISLHYPVVSSRGTTFICSTGNNTHRQYITHLKINEKGQRKRKI